MSYLSRPPTGKVSPCGGKFPAFRRNGLGTDGWDRLRYDPPFATASLAAYRAMVARFTPVPATALSPDWGDWRAAPRPKLLARCPAHELFQGELGCRLCDPDIQPIG
jgi:hypothetical protein